MYNAYMVTGVAQVEQVDSELQDLELASFVDVSKLPSPYLDCFQRLESVPHAGDGYPIGYIEDNAKNHTLRTMNFVRNLGFAPGVEQIAMRTSFIHSLPKAGGDYSAVDGNYPQNHDDQELEVAEKLFSKVDLGLYTTFKQAELFLRPDSDTNFPASSFISRAVFLTKIVDSIDGNLHFHRSLADRVRSGQTDFPPDNSLEWMFKQFSIYMEKFEKLKVPPKDIEGLTNMLVDQLITVQHLWCGLREPHIISDRFYRFQKHTSDRIAALKALSNGLNS